MTLTTLIAAFGGGVFGALIGGTTAFIFTGLLGLIGIAIILGGGGDFVLNEVALGVFFGPHVAFVGAVAASAYLGRKKTRELKKAGLPSGLDAQQIYSHEYDDYKIDRDLISKLVDGADINTPLFKSNNPMALIIAGLFGVAGHSLNYFFANILELPIDTIALNVLIFGLLCRFLFGSSGLVGRYPKGESRFAPVTKSLLFTIIWAFGLSAVTGYIVLELEIETIGFVISATSLIFTYFGLSFPVSHHVTMVTGFAAITFGNIWLPILFGILAAVSGDYTQRAINTHVDTHIDMPGTIIALWSFVILGILG